MSRAGPSVKSIRSEPPTMTTPRTPSWLAPLFLALGLCGAAPGADEADLILHHGKVVTVDRDFSIRQALAVKGDRLIRVGTDDEVLKTRGPNTTVVDLGGKMVLPGLIDSHTHPTGACMTEFDHPIPEMETIADVLDYIQVAGRSAGPGEVGRRPPGLHHPAQGAALSRPGTSWTGPRPSNPVLFATGPDASLNSLALKLSGIDKDFQHRRAGQGREGPTHRRADRHPPQLHAVRQGDRPPSASRREQDQDRRLLELFQDYNSVGITSVIDRDADAMRPSTATAGCTRPAP